MFSKEFYYAHKTRILIACIEIALSKNGKGVVSCNMHKNYMLCIVVNHKLKRG